MTFSIVARDERTGHLGVAVASRFFAVGAYTIHGRAGAGVCSSQAKANPLLGIDAADAMARGEAPDVLLERLMAGDEGHAIRQVHCVDRAGRAAAWTGEECIAWCGHAVHDGFSVAGNMLAGPEVIAEMARGYRAAGARPFAERLMWAMEAGEFAGGDKRGRQAAALLILDDQPYALMDLRVDDHPHPLSELRRLYGFAVGERIIEFRKGLPRRSVTAPT